MGKIAIIICLICVCLGCKYTPPAVAVKNPKSASSYKIYAPKVIRDKLECVVFIVTRDEGGDPVSSGTGWVVDKSGLILTAHHIFNHIRVKSAEVKIVANGKVVVKQVQWRLSLPRHDFLLLRVSYRFQKELSLRYSDLVSGEPIYEVGFPLPGRPPADLAKFNPLIAITKGEFVRYWTLEAGSDGLDTIVGLANVHHMRGQSGGPVFDRNGEVVGMVHGHILFDGIPFSIMLKPQYYLDISFLRMMSIERYP